jgi:hypothetical protein
MALAGKRGGAHGRWSPAIRIDTMPVNCLLEDDRG